MGRWMMEGLESITKLVDLIYDESNMDDHNR